MLDAMFDGLKRKRRAAWNRNVAEVPPVVQVGISDLKLILGLMRE